MVLYRTYRNYSFSPVLRWEDFAYYTRSSRPERLHALFLLCITSCAGAAKRFYFYFVWKMEKNVQYLWELKLYKEFRNTIILKGRKR